MVTYYAVKIRKELALAIPILILLLVFGYYTAKNIWNWDLTTSTLSSVTSPTATSNPKTLQPLTDVNCESFQPQLDAYAQQAFKDGYLCAKQKSNCPVPEPLSSYEQNRLEHKSIGYSFDAQHYVNTKSTTRQYYTNLMTDTYACTPQNLELLKKFVYEQQWKAGAVSYT
ncbi:MAG: hypothetical protein AABX70_07175 [Nanoarchaeota archaeon]